MWPKIENVTTPANKEVSVFITHVIIASLKKFRRITPARE